jgi:hypothetical protein
MVIVRLALATASILSLRMDTGGTDTSDWSEGSRTLNSFWPLAPEQPLPPQIFPADWLQRCLFEMMPIAFSCPPSAIRQGLKSFLKSASPITWRSLAGEDISARDRSAALAFCNSKTLRARAKDLEFLVPRNVTKFGRQRAVSKVIKPGFTFPQLIWRAFLQDKSTRVLANWCIDVGIERPELGSGIYLTSSLLQSLELKSIPGSIDSIDLARAMILFAARLPPAEALDLLRYVHASGCTHLKITIDDKDLTGAQKTTSILEKNIDCLYQKPHLTRDAELLDLDFVTCDEQSADLSAQVSMLERSATDSRQAALEELVNPSKLLDGPREDWDRALTAVTQYRSVNASLTSCRERALAHYRTLVRELQEWISLPPDSFDLFGTIPFSQFPTSLIQQGAIKRLRGLYPVSSDVMEKWKASVTDGVTIDDVRKLLISSANKHAVEQSRESFCRAAMQYYCTEREEPISTWLTLLDTNELLALVDALRYDPWIVGAAILFRLAIEKCSVDDNIVIDDVIFRDVSPIHLRPLLTFIDPSTSNFDSTPEVKRVIAVERLRDVFTFGPLAEITDPSSGLSDASIVGKTVVDLAGLVGANLNHFPRNPDFYRLLNPEDETRRADSALIEFIKTPSTMSGLYRRLREHARELLFLPIIVNDTIEITAARRIADKLVDSNYWEDVAESYKEERHESKLEARHKLQLQRYLQAAKQLLDDFTQEIDLTPTPRAKILRRELKQICFKLRGGGNPGTVPWVESQVRQMLSGAEFRPSVPTLLGDARPLAERDWEPNLAIAADTALDLPEFHFAKRPTFAEIAASCLHWRARGRTPSPSDLVDSLLRHNELRPAMSVALEHADQSLVDSVKAAARPDVEQLRERERQIKERFGQPIVQQCGSFSLFEEKLRDLDLKASGEILDLVELEAEEYAASIDTDLHDDETKNKRNTYFEYLAQLGLDSIDVATSTRDLESLWKAEYDRGVSQRQHLQTVEGVMSSVAEELPELTPALAAFNASNLNPKRWLSPQLSEEFAKLIADPITRIGTWAGSAGFILPQERQALINLTAWFIAFISERSESLKSARRE